MFRFMLIECAARWTYRKCTLRRNPTYQGGGTVVMYTKFPFTQNWPQQSPVQFAACPWGVTCICITMRTNFTKNFPLEHFHFP
jgi:hypothetical protein